MYYKLNKAYQIAAEEGLSLFTENCNDYTKDGEDGCPNFCKWNLTGAKKCVATSPPYCAGDWPCGGGNNPTEKDCKESEEQGCQWKSHCTHEVNAGICDYCIKQSKRCDISSSNPNCCGKLKCQTMGNPIGNICN